MKINENEPDYKFGDVNWAQELIASNYWKEASVEVQKAKADRKPKGRSLGFMLGCKQGPNKSESLEIPVDQKPVLSAVQVPSDNQKLEEIKKQSLEIPVDQKPVISAVQAPSENQKLEEIKNESLEVPVDQKPVISAVQVPSDTQKLQEIKKIESLEMPGDQTPVISAVQVPSHNQKLEEIKKESLEIPVDQKPVLTAVQAPSDTQKLQASAPEQKAEEPPALRRLGHIDESGATAEEEQKPMEKASLPEDVAAIAQIYDRILRKAVDEDTVKNRAGAFEKADDDEILRMISAASQHPEMNSFRVYMELKEGFVGYEIGDVDVVDELLAFGYWQDACKACKAEKSKAERKSKSNGWLSMMSQCKTEQSNVKRPALESPAETPTPKKQLFIEPVKVAPQQELVSQKKPLLTPSPSPEDSQSKGVEQTRQPIHANKHEIKDNGQQDLNDAVGALNGLDPLKLLKIIQDLSQKLKEKDEAAVKTPQPLPQVVTPIQPQESPCSALVVQQAPAPVHAEDRQSSLALALPTKGLNSLTHPKEWARCGRFCDRNPQCTE